MDIRGAGNILGDEQSGFVKEVGVELYQQMLEETIMKLKSGDLETEETSDYVPSLNLGISILIPDSYIPDVNIKLEFYKRISMIKDNEEMDALISEMIDRFGDIPDEVQNLIDIVDLKVLCKKANVEKIDAGEMGLLISFHENKFNNPLGLIELLNKSNAIKLRPDHKLNIVKDLKKNNEVLKFTKKMLNELVKISQSN
ncbi:MAG: Transcription-repair-coupling factor [Alphaproteobacteria bacterium ADurb.Bin438]|nr:MAG: Transcription-repair-coupling factor [Alphaproteobacteria bacterium ADurb.Bin438]